MKKSKFLHDSMKLSYIYLLIQKLLIVTLFRDPTATIWPWECMILKIILYVHWRKLTNCRRAEKEIDQWQKNLNRNSVAAFRTIVGLSTCFKRKAHALFLFFSSQRQQKSTYYLRMYRKFWFKFTGYRKICSSLNPLKMLVLTFQSTPYLLIRYAFERSIYFDSFNEIESTRFLFTFVASVHAVMLFVCGHS